MCCPSLFFKHQNTLAVKNISWGKIDLVKRCYCLRNAWLTLYWIGCSPAARLLLPCFFFIFNLKHLLFVCGNNRNQIVVLIYV